MRGNDARSIQRRRRLVLVACVALAVVGLTFYDNWTASRQPPPQTKPAISVSEDQTTALHALGKLAIKAAAPRDGYARDQFGSGWSSVAGCDTRNLILQRDLEKDVLDVDGCTLLSGTLDDRYTDKMIAFTRGPGTSDDVQIDHVVALSNAWQTGAQQLTPERRQEFANDPLNLLAVDGPANQQKSDSDASEWLPHKSYRCRYIARQIAVKIKYTLWVTKSEHEVMNGVLQTCLTQKLPT